MDRYEHQLIIMMYEFASKTNIVFDKIKSGFVFENSIIQSIIACSQNPNCKVAALISQNININMSNIQLKYQNY